MRYADFLTLLPALVKLTTPLNGHHSFRVQHKHGQSSVVRSQYLYEIRNYSRALEVSNINFLAFIHWPSWQQNLKSAAGTLYRNFPTKQETCLYCVGYQYQPANHWEKINYFVVNNLPIRNKWYSWTLDISNTIPTQY